MDELDNMEDMYKLAKEQLTTDMFTEFNEIRENTVVPDFEIRVGGEVFPVHRLMLIAASKYCKNFFKNNQDEFVEIKGLEADGIKYCLQYIYTRDVDLATAPMAAILHASHIMQIDELNKLCFGYLKLKLSKDNCISTLKIFQQYKKDDLKKAADQFILDNWSDVVETDQIFLLDKEELNRFLDKAKEDYVSSWKAVTRWLHNQENL